jgi:hypothetical protein
MRVYRCLGWSHWPPNMPEPVQTAQGAPLLGLEQELNTLPDSEAEVPLYMSPPPKSLTPGSYQACTLSVHLICPPWSQNVPVVLASLLALGILNVAARVQNYLGWVCVTVTQAKLAPAI